MNPENTGEQIKMRHSSLWRKPFLFEKSVPQSSSCHTQMNQLGETGVSWRIRNNSISTHSNFNTKFSIPRKTHSKHLSEILDGDKSSCQEERHFVKSLKGDAKIIDKSQQLISGLHTLRKMNLLLSRNLQKVKFPGVGRYAHIHNDYHERITNPGYSRNFLGKFYMK